MISTTIIGNLCSEPVLREIQLKSGDIVKACNFRVAVNNPYNKAKDQISDKDVMYIQITAWRGLANAAKQYLHTGSKVYVEGIMQAQLGEDKNGNHYANNVMNANRVEFLSPKRTEQTDDMVIPPDVEEEEAVEEPAPAPAPKKAAPKKAAPAKAKKPAVDPNNLPF